MTNKEKYLQKIASKPSKAVEQAKWRNANREWLCESQKLAVIIMLELDNKGLKQVDLAEAIGKSPQYVNKLLRGNEKFGFEILVKIQNALNFPLLSTFEPKKSCRVISFEKKGSIEGSETIPNYSCKSKLINFTPNLSRSEMIECEETLKETLKEA